MNVKNACNAKIIISCVCLILSACAANLPPQTEKHTPVERVHKSVQSAYAWVNGSVEYRWNSQQIYQAAANRIYQYMGDEKERKWGVILDLDQTVLDNSGFQALLLERGVDSYDHQLWSEWVERSQATLVPGALVFLEEVKRLGGLVIIVSNRADHHKQASENNLAALGVPYDEILLMSDDRSKVARWQSAISDIGFMPVLWIGDQITDFPLFNEDYTGDDCPLFSTAYSYAATEEAFLSEQLGRCIFVIANPLYGGWK